MSIAIRLAAHVLAWTASIPVLSVLLTDLDRRGTFSLAKHGVEMAAMALLAWAVWIYWRRVPHAARLLERSARFASFVLVMLMAAALALYATFWLIVAIYGL